MVKVDLKNISRFPETSILHYGFYASNFGTIAVCFWGNDIVYCDLIHSKAEALERIKHKFPEKQYKENNKKAEKIIKNIFERKQKSEVNLYVQGTDFQIAVWKQILTIPFGKTKSYSNIAKAIGKPLASRAVGSAVGANTFFYLIPCHRVVAKSGKIKKFRWGSDIKKKLLDWEQSQK